MKLSREFKIGFISLFALALLIWGVNYLKGISIFKRSSTYYAVYNNISGLIESAFVYLNGYQVGNVTEIQFNPENTDRIVVEFAVDKRINLAVNTQAIIRSSSLISGVKDIYLEPGMGPGTYAEGDTLASDIDEGMLDSLEPLLAQVQSVVISIDSVFTSVDEVLNDETRVNLQSTIGGLSDVLGSLRLLLQPDGHLGTTLENFASISDNIKQNNEDITQSLENLSAISDTLRQADLKMLIQHLDETFTQTSGLFEMINAGQGTAGQLIMNDTLYQNLNQSLASLDSLLIDLRENPGRYVRFSLFGGRD